MAFFEELGKKLSDAGQGVAQQTKNFTEVGRLNSAVADKEKRVAQLYTALGRAYYEKHKDDETVEGGETIRQINALRGEIAQCQEEIKRLKGVTKCPACGADVPSSAAFCSKCGAAMPKVEPDKEPEEAPTGSRECPSCHQMVTGESQFCTNCGAKL